jgi:hypothetical protein
MYNIQGIKKSLETAKADVELYTEQLRIALEQQREDPFVADDVITFIKLFGKDPNDPLTKKYTYVGIKKNGSWWMSGRSSGPITWEQLWEYINKDEKITPTIWCVTEWEERKI